MAAAAVATTTTTTMTTTIYDDDKTTRRGVGGGAGEDCREKERERAKTRIIVYVPFYIFYSDDDASSRQRILQWTERRGWFHTLILMKLAPSCIIPRVHLYTPARASRCSHCHASPLCAANAIIRFCSATACRMRVHRSIIHYYIIINSKSRVENILCNDRAHAQYTTTQQSTITTTYNCHDIRPKFSHDTRT